MKKIKMKMLMMFLSVALFSGVASAQHGKDPSKGAKMQTEWMKKELALSDDQAAKVESINLKYATRNKEMREQMKAQHEAMRLEKNKDMEAVLTKEQMTKYQTKQEEMKAKRKERGKDKQGCKKGCKK